LNPLPPACKAGALPDELHPRRTPRLTRLLTCVNTFFDEGDDFNDLASILRRGSRQLALVGTDEPRARNPASTEFRKERHRVDAFPQPTDTGRGSG
jgi:hypothetical protein